MLCVARPLDSAAAAQLGIADSGVVAGAAGAASLPCLESRLGILPRRQRLAVFVAEVHPPRVVEKEVEVGSGGAGWLNGLLGQVHGSVGVGEGAGLFGPCC